MKISQHGRCRDARNAAAAILHHTGRADLLERNRRLPAAGRCQAAARL